MIDKVEEIETEVKPGSIPEPRETAKPPSVRESIRAALREQEEKEVVEDTTDTDDPKDTAEEIEAKKAAAAERKAKKEAKEKAEADAKDTGDGSKEVTTKEAEEAETPKVEEPKEKANLALPKEVKDDWAKLSPASRNFINKATKELGDTKAELGRTLAAKKAMDDVVAPYLPEIKSFGVTPEHTVSKLFEWMKGLTGPHKQEVYRQLGRSFGVSLDQADPGNYTPDPQYDQSHVLQEISPVLQTFGNEINQIKTQFESQRQAEADNTIYSWAGLQADGTFKNKPYFGEVRGLMANFVKTGVVPLVNGRPDLDSAYEMACRTHPQVFEAIQQEQKEAKAAEEAKAKEAAAKKAKAEAAKKAGSSVRSSAPQVAAPARTRTENRPLNGKAPSVRESLINSIKELRE